MKHAPMIRPLASEVPVALVFNGSTQAVMMATPDDFPAFGVGFALSEGIVSVVSEIERTEVVTHDQGVEVQMWIAADRAEALADRRRSMVGPVGCGLCGIDSLAQAARDLPRVAGGFVMQAGAVAGVTDQLRQHQPLHDETRAVHCAGFWRDGIVTACEDVGRHNALDKLIGRLALTGQSASDGAVVMTSRVSVDLVQKVALAGCPVLIAVGAPTTAAVTQADAAGLTLIGLAKGDDYTIFTHPQRITGHSDAD